MFPMARGPVRRKTLSGGASRWLVALLLLASLPLELLPCTGLCPGDHDADARPCVGRLRVCGGADYAPGSLADQSILRSETLLPLPPGPLHGPVSDIGGSLSEGFPPPVDRPPRPAA